MWPVCTGWLLAVVMTNSMGGGTECGEGIVFVLAGMYTYLEGIVRIKSSCNNKNLGELRKKDIMK